MKKVLFTMFIIAVLVGVAFAGMAAAGNGNPITLSTIDSKITALDGKVINLDTKVNNLQGNVSDIKDDVATIKGDTDSTKKNVEITRTEVENLSTVVSFIRGNVSAIRSDLADVTSDLANVTIMETVKGSYHVHDTGDYYDVYEVYYPELRHVSVTLYWLWLDHASQYIYLNLDMASGQPYTIFSASDESWPGATLEFDTNHWWFSVYNDWPVSDYWVYYSATVTYPRSP